MSWMKGDETPKLCICCGIRPRMSAYPRAKYCRECSMSVNSIKLKAIHNAARAKKMNLPGSFSAIDWVSLCLFFDNKCLCCKKTFNPVDLAPDHVVPLSKGGSNYISNIQPLCSYCNGSKYTETKDYRDICFLGAIP